MRDAVLNVVFEDLQGDSLERRIDGRKLREDVDAVAVVLDHLLDPAHLALDPVQALDERVLVGRIAVHHADSPCRLEWNRRRRSEFETTNRLENAIAPAAMIGLSRPETASGIAAAL